MEHLEQPPAEIIRLLTPFLSTERMARLADVISRRTDTVVTVIEGLINFGNVSAVMRSAEALGFHKFHIIEGDAAFKNSQRTSQGADKWLDVSKWSTPAACIPTLQAQGYNVVATHLDETAVNIDEIDFTKPTALVFGNEADGVSDALLELADQRCIIPMAGFVQSFNISVAAAVALYHAYHDRMSRQGFHGDLGEAAQEALLASYCYRSVNHADDILLKIREG
ncbi:MAG: RNA methyltransferase [Bacteroidota bacterium]